MEVRVLFEGHLDKYTNEHGKKDWKRRYFVFKHILASNIRSLEFYAAGTKHWRKTEPKGVLALYPGYEILKFHDPKKHFVFEIKAVDHTYRLAAHSEDELKKWILILERESVVNSFFVEPESNEQLTKVGASESCHLHIANNELRLLCAKDGRLLVAWPLTCLRRYMSSRGKFVVEAGRRAPTGEGKFTFLSPQHDEIYKVLDSVVKSRANKVDSSSSTQASPRKTKDKDVPHNGYERLMVTSANNQPMSSGSSNPLKNAYAAPYGHLPPRETIKTCPTFVEKSPGSTNVVSAESENDNQYTTLNHSQQGHHKHLEQQDVKDVDNEYGTLEKQNVYNVLLHQRDTTQLKQRRNQPTDHEYNVLGQTPSGMCAPDENSYNSLNTMTNSLNQVPALGPRGEQAYNTLDHAVSCLQPVTRTPPRPLVKKPTDDRNKGPAPEDDETYNRLETRGRSPSPVKKSISLHAGNDIQTSRRPPPPPPCRTMSDQTIKLQKSQEDLDKSNEYNTLDAVVVGHSPVKRRLFPAQTDESEEMYNSLDAATRIGPDEMYNKLDSLRVHGKSHLAISSDHIDDMYNTLDKSRMQHSSSVPASPLRQFQSPDSNLKNPLSSPVKKDGPSFRRNSSSGLNSMQHPLNIAEPQLAKHNRSSSLDDLDSHTSMDPPVASFQSNEKKRIPIPARRPLNPRRSPSKPQKASAPNAITSTTTEGGKDGRKGGKSRLVLNLKASLEAGGLDFSKPRRKPRKLSREESGDLPRYAEGDEHAVSTPSSTEEIFDPSTPPVQLGWSCSSPDMHNLQKEGDINKSEHLSSILKPQQIDKVKKSPKK